ELKYGVTQSLTLDLTVNTDFAQVEVDEQRTNLTRFPLFFPEKRPFFLENAGVFSAGTPQAVDLFFTRRIGIDALGQPVPIVGGVSIGDPWTIDWWGAASATSGPDTDVVAYSARLGYEAGSWSNVARIIQVGRDFNPEVGFLNRGGGYRYYEIGGEWKKRFPSLPWVKQWIPHINYRGYYGLDDFWQEGRIHFDLTEVELANGG